MQPKILLRIAAILLLLHLVGHTLGHIGWNKANAPEQKAVISQMTDHSFLFMGANRSYAQFFEGYGYACSIALALMMVMLWFLSSADQSSVPVRRMLVAIWIALLLWGAIELRYFFLAAAAITLLASLLTILATVARKPKLVTQ